MVFEINDDSPSSTSADSALVLRVAVRRRLPVTARRGAPTRSPRENGPARADIVRKRVVGLKGRVPSRKSQAKHILSLTSRHAGMDDDAALAREVRELREGERLVVDALRQDGTFDSLRKRLVEDASAKNELREVVATALANSDLLKSLDPSRKMSEKEMVDALRHELEDEVMTAFSKELWDLMTDEQEGLGRELYEAVYAARERLKKT